ncbi:(2Fe-2S)-binding protein [Burkholderia sp. R-69927]|nr:(2Fe-2S)-binding protein [Paraburkholderia domus]MBK5051087.1 (2Fe-2S)-binding protein [Burkholderia sp. R-70006]MBK5065027.1 (2Fe-2S)-binding protein [Burkholderia sp. R-70199]MBK5091014.1 (2Fe-2S)-binding protein [Burkholderia sp. R-69927]MBK5118665.1 (2Fe-2S)-binding protein [Burkholderia sp. R-69980]MBK5164503.1 (2Fe-2S)-binding protein [Burkholderia sp. R-70211]MBK5181802.1 (2Fe-2S)-binding protein [Burkholderia sp. R-69749]MCI0144685.1 (2Fe-2S)-binding protein [Paraburkholderia sedi
MPSNLPSSEPAAPKRDAQFVRVAETQREPLSFFIDGHEVTALQGDTLLTAVLMHQRHVRESEFSGAPRAGFCLIGACQDCWMRTEEGMRLRACSTLVTQGMRVVTRLAEVTSLVAPVVASAAIANGDIE